MRQKNTKRIFGVIAIIIYFTLSQSVNLFAQETFVVTGTVTSAKDLYPLPGVNIVVAGTAQGTITDFKGKYSLQVPGPNSKLKFSFIGFEDTIIALNGRKQVDVQLQEASKKIDEIVVIGYGAVKKSDVTGALSSVSNEDIKNVPAVGIEQALQGKASGVEVINNTGAPGSSMTVRIRGMGTLNSGKSPLYVVDGIIMGDQNFGKEGGQTPDNKTGIEFLDPNDIESIEVLKDASAAAIYGARGANGVILITTKKGKSGMGKIDVDVYRGVQNLAKKTDVMNAHQYRDYMNSYQAAFGGRRDTFPGFGYDSQLNETDWQDEIFSPAIKEKYKVTFSGGNEKNTYLLSASYFNQEGIIKSSGYDKFSVRFNGEHQLREKIKFGEQIIVTYTNRNRISEGVGGSNLVSGALLADPSISPYVSGIRDPEMINYINDSTIIWTDLFRSGIVANPIATIDLDEYNYQSYHYFGNAYVDIELLPSLSFKSIIGIDITNGDMDSFYPRYEINPSDRRDQNLYYKRHEKWINWNSENILTFSKSFGEHNLTVMTAFTAQRETYRDLRLTMKPFPYDEEFMRYPNLPSPEGKLNEVGSSPMAYSIISLLARAIYSYKDKLHLTTSFRRDGSSKFGPNQRYGNFPSFSLAYKISHEEFLQNIAFIDLLKIRAGWGKLGNQSIPPYQYSTTIYAQGNNYAFGPSRDILTGFLPNGVSNPDIKWEETSQFNLGLDFGLINSQLTGSIDAFYKKTTDMLMKIPIVKFSGIHNLERVGGAQPTASSNAAEMENKGLELTLNYQTNINAFYINVGGNISFVRNEVISLADDKPVYSNQSNLFGYMSTTMTNEPVAGFYGYIVEGIFQNYQEIANHADQGKTDPYLTDPKVDEPKPQKFTAPGDFKFKDIDGNGVIDEDDETLIGSPLPDFTYGMHLNMTYKNFDLYVSTNGVYGNDVVNMMKYYLYGYKYCNHHVDASDYWTEENTDAKYPRIGIDKNENMRFSDFYIEDGSYMRIQNITLGYTLPENLSNRLRIKRLRIYGTIENLWTVTKYSGLEPEIGSSVGWNAKPLDFGVDAATYPHPRTFIVGVNLSL